MNDVYDDLGNIMGDMEAYVGILETMLLNGENLKANMHIREAMKEMMQSLSELSDALFEVTT